MDGKMEGAHRVSYRMCNGEIPKGMVIRHSCDNRWCVNPLHLAIGTYKDNMQDMASRRRHKYGEKNSFAKLKEQDVRFIRSMRGIMTQQALADQFGCSQVKISQVQLGKNWRHVQQDD